MKRLPLGPLVYEFSRHLEPSVRIEPGETIAVESDDAFSGQIRTAEDRRDKSKMPFSNPLTGPIFVSGAEPGDALAVTIQSIQPTRGHCVTRTSDPNQLAQWLGNDCPHGTHLCPIVDGQIARNTAEMLFAIATATAGEFDGFQVRFRKDVNGVWRIDAM